MARSGTWSEITATASTSWTGWPLGRSYPPGTPIAGCTASAGTRTWNGWPTILRPDSLSWCGSRPVIRCLMFVSGGSGRFPSWVASPSATGRGAPSCSVTPPIGRLPAAEPVSTRPVADGLDLGWKLAWVMRGWADESLLDSYEAERRPVAEHNLDRSLDPTGSRRSVIDEVHVDLGPRLQHLWLSTDGRHPDGGRQWKATG